MNTLAFTNHLLADVFALTAFMREAHYQNSQKATPDIQAAWERAAPLFSGSGFPKFEALGPAIAGKVPLEKDLVDTYTAWAGAASEKILPLMEEVLAQELIPRYQRAVVEAFPDIVLPDAYERLLLDALKGDASLFARNDGIEEAWRLIDPIIAGWETAAQAPPLHTYPMNSWGPGAADELLARSGHAWRIGCCGLPCS